jgi:uncharacterized membrane protein
MKKIKHMFIVGLAVLALAASTAVLPSVADAHVGGGHAGHGAHFAGGHRGGRGYAGGGYYGGGVYCGPLQIAAGLCGPYAY